MKHVLLTVLMLMTLNVFGSDKGNGGSGSESQIAAQQVQLELVASKIRTFFLQNESAMQPKFPEFDIKTLTKKIKVSDIIVTDETKLIDKHGKSRTCLNFPEKSLIKCKSSGIDPILSEPTALFVLIFHEYLGLIGAEETSPTNPRVIDGYSISKRLAPYLSSYVTNVNNFDLSLEQKPAVQTSITWNDGTPVAKISGQNWYGVPKKTKRIKVQLESHGAYIRQVSYELYAREISTKEWKLQTKGDFTIKSEISAYVPFESDKEYYIQIIGDAMTFYNPDPAYVEPHTERLKLIADNNYVIFDSQDMAVVIDKDDIRAVLSSFTNLDYMVYFK